MIECRTLQVETDLDALLALEESCFEDDRWSEQQLASHLKHPYGTSLLFSKGGRPCGFILAHVLFDEAELYQIGVDQACRGQGMGRKMLESLITQLKERGVCRLMLEVRASNTPAVNLYESCGFVLDGKRKGYYARQGETEDALLYSYAISA